MVEYNDFPNTSEGVMHCKVVCTTPLRDGQKNSLQERSSPISGASHASRRSLRRWPSILDALSHSCVTARMPSKRRTIFLNTRTPHPTIFNRDIAPWCWKQCDSPVSLCYWKIRRSCPGRGNMPLRVLDPSTTVPQGSRASFYTLS